jgi:hypothetical protein
VPWNTVKILETSRERQGSHFVAVAVSRAPRFHISAADGLDVATKIDISKNAVPQADSGFATGDGDLGRGQRRAIRLPAEVPSSTSARITTRPLSFAIKPPNAENAGIRSAIVWERFRLVDRVLPQFKQLLRLKRRVLFEHRAICSCSQMEGARIEVPEANHTAGTRLL